MHCHRNPKAANDIFVLFFPFFLAFFLFGIEFIFLREQHLKKLAEVTFPLLQFTSTFRVFSETGNYEFLYFWAFFLSMFPLHIFVLWRWWSYIKGKGRISFIVGASSKSIIGSIVFVAIFLGILLIDTDAYQYKNVGSIFSPNLFGVAAYAFMFEGLCFFSLLLALKLVASCYSYLNRGRN